MKTPVALFVWVDSFCGKIARRVLDGMEIVETTKELKKVVHEKIDPAPNVIVCGKCLYGNKPANEVVREIMAAYPNVPLVYATSDRAGYDRKSIEGEGCRGAFLLPFEADDFERLLTDVAFEVSGTAAKVFRPVKLVDINGDDELTFDTFVFLPLNGKYICYSRAGSRLTNEQRERLLSREVTSLYLRQIDMEKFYQFSAQQLAKVGKSDAISLTEKQAKIKEMVRSILSDLFSESRAPATDEEGQSLVENCREIIKSYITSEPTTAQGRLYGKLLEMTIEGSGPYSHATNVSTFAALFSLGLQIGDPEEVALAGLLHDLGLALVPPDVLEKGADGRAIAYDFAHDEKNIYYQHPEFSIRQINDKHMAVSDKVKEIVLQHHECYSGVGYPRKLSGDQILPEAQILAFADLLEELISMETGKTRMTPRQAVQAIIAMENQDPAKRRFDPKILDQLIGLLGESADNASMAA